MPEMLEEKIMAKDKLSDEEKERLIFKRMKERGIKQLCFWLALIVDIWWPNDRDFIRGECLICGMRVFIPREGKPIWQREVERK